MLGQRASGWRGHGKTVDAVRIAALRKNGKSWRTIAREMKLSVGTVFAAAQSDPDSGQTTELAA